MRRGGREVGRDEEIKERYGREGIVGGIRGGRQGGRKGEGGRHCKEGVGREWREGTMQWEEQRAMKVGRGGMEEGRK